MSTLFLLWIRQGAFHGQGLYYLPGMKVGRSMDMPIIIGHTIYAFKDGGMEQGLLNIINYGDHECFRHVIVCFTEIGAFANRVRAPACVVVELHKRHGNDLRLPWRIAAAARQHGIDIFHARGWPTLVETAVAARLCGVAATIYGFHGKTIEDLQGLSLRRRWVQKIAIRCYSRVMTLNRRMQSDLAAECSLPENRIHAIANGVDVDHFRPREDGRALRVRFGLPTDRFIIGNVARLDPVKNHAVILHALRRLQGYYPKPFLLLVGDGPHRSAVEEEIERLHLAADVRLLGYSDCIPELLNCMDLYIQSSFYEGFSNTVLEAMACGLPVLATDTGGTINLFSEGREGFFFRPQDGETLASRIIQLQRDNPLRRVMAGRARQRAVGQFSVQTMVHSYETMYLELATVARSRRKRDSHHGKNHFKECHQ